MIIMYRVEKTPYNEENYPSLVGQLVDNPPAYAICTEVRVRVR